MTGMRCGVLGISLLIAFFGGLGTLDPLLQCWPASGDCIVDIKLNWCLSQSGPKFRLVTDYELAPGSLLRILVIARYCHLYVYA